MALVQRLPRPANLGGRGALVPEHLEGPSRALRPPQSFHFTEPNLKQIPAVLFYQRVDASELLDFSSLPLSSQPEILCQDITISRYVHHLRFSRNLSLWLTLCCLPRNRDPNLIKHQPFTLQELPRRGTLVSIDAEFVSLQQVRVSARCLLLILESSSIRRHPQEEAEFHSDGTKKVIRPSRMTLARVSVLRGEGPDTGIPFIDDHIHTSDTVVDYLTEFSGIRGAAIRARLRLVVLTSLCTAGDLDPAISRHTLVPLKVAYKKLRLLVDLGCVFIGHGLNKDFRIISSAHPLSPNIAMLTCTPVRHLHPARADHRHGQHLPPGAPAAQAVAPLPRVGRAQVGHPGRHSRLD